MASKKLSLQWCKEFYHTPMGETSFYWLAIVGLLRCRVEKFEWRGQVDGFIWSVRTSYDDCIIYGRHENLAGAKRAAEEMLGQIRDQINLALQGMS